MKKQILSAALCILAVLLVWAGQNAAAETTAAVKLCLNVMIPSLYAFTIISKLIISSDAYRLFAKPFGLFTRYILRMPEEFFPVFIISQFAGYPIGASLISGMYSSGRISRQEAEKMLCFCIGAGPAYIMAVAGAAAPLCPKAWAALFLSTAGANLLLVLITAPFRPLPKKSSNEYTVTLDAHSFTEAVISGAKSMTLICGSIILAAAFMGILSKAKLLPLITKAAAAFFKCEPITAYPFVRSFFEISNLTSVIGDSYTVLPAAAAMLSFGGLCVHLQIKSVCGSLSVVPLLIARIPSAVLAFFLCRKILPNFYTVTAISVSAPIGESISVSNNQPILSIILLIMTILILSQKNVVKTKKMCYNRLEKKLRS